MGKKKNTKSLLDFGKPKAKKRRRKKRNSNNETAFNAAAGSSRAVDATNAFSLLCTSLAATAGRRQEELSRLSTKRLQVERGTNADRDGDDGSCEPDALTQSKGKDLSSGCDASSDDRNSTETSDHPITSVNSNAGSEVEEDAREISGECSDLDEDHAGSTKGSDVTADDLTDDISSGLVCTNRFVTPLKLSLDDMEGLKGRARVSVPAPEHIAKRISGLGIEGLTASVTRPCNLEQVLQPAPPALALSAGILPKLTKQWTQPLTSLQRVVLPVLSSYTDMIFCNRADSDANELQDLYALHVLNHVLRSRNRVNKNDARLRAAKKLIQQRKAELRAGVQQEEEAMPIPQGPEVDEDAGCGRDQGFCRPRVLILLPFRADAERCVRQMLKFLPPRVKVHNRKRFFEEYGDGDGEGTDNEAEESDPDVPEWQRVFKGNTDDCFRIGLQMSRSTLRLYSDFYHSDVIIASPLGLRLATGTEEDGAKADTDFLSSIELAVVDRAGFQQMQNWENVTNALASLNQMPKRNHDTDFARVYEWALEGQARFYRQTVFLSEFPTLKMRAAVRTHCRGAGGIVRWRRASPGVLQRLLVTTRQVFQRITAPAAAAGDAPSADSIGAAYDRRLAYFEKYQVPSLEGENGQSHVIIFTASNWDFVRVKALLRRRLPKGALCCLAAHTSASKLAKARTDFFHGRRRVMLVSGRFLFFKRYRLRGARHLLFYSLPLTASFYCDLAHSLESSDSSGRSSRGMRPVLSALAGADTSMLALFDKYDALQLEGVVGRSRCRRMLQSDQDVFLFC